MNIVSDDRRKSAGRVTLGRRIAEGVLAVWIVAIPTFYFVQYWPLAESVLRAVTQFMSKNMP